MLIRVLVATQVLRVRISDLGAWAVGQESKFTNRYNLFRNVSNSNVLNSTDNSRASTQKKMVP